MKTELLAIDRVSPDPAVLRRAASVLRAGGLVAFPTETVYGLGAAALDAAAVARIFEAKGRPPTNPLIVHVESPAAARELASQWPPAAERLAERFWPGPLTLVVARRDIVPDLVTAGGPTVGLRVPRHPVALGLIRAAGLPVAAPSANPSSRISPTTAAHVLKGLDGRIDLVLDAAWTPGGLESTVVDVTVDPPRLLRPGLISVAQLEAALGTQLAGPAAAALQDAEPMRSPGQHELHYAPHVPAELAANEDEAARRVDELTSSGRRVGWLTFSAPRQGGPGLTVGMPREPTAYAAVLYTALHHLEDAGAEWIVVTGPPASPGWEAVRDRLQRATARRTP